MIFWSYFVNFFLIEVVGDVNEKIEVSSDLKLLVLRDEGCLIVWFWRCFLFFEVVGGF